MDKTLFLIGAYSAVWLILLIYVLSISRRLRQMEHRLEDLEDSQGEI